MVFEPASRRMTLAPEGLELEPVASAAMGALGFKTVLSPKTPAAAAPTNPKPASHFWVDLLPPLLVDWLAKTASHTQYI